MQPPRRLRLNRFLADLAPGAQWLLTDSEVEPYRLGEVLALADEATRELWERLSLGYAAPGGHGLLRKEIASLYQGVAADEVTVCAGGDDALLLVLGAVLGPGDHALVVRPSYEPLQGLAAATGAEVTSVPLDPADWSLGLEAVRAELRATTRAIVVNFPHNPTGALPSRAILDGLAALAAEAGAHLVSDEVYRLLEYDPADRLPAAVEYGGGAISIGAVSKSFGLAGVRIGWLATRDDSVRVRVASVRDSTSSANSAPSEILALTALRARERVLARSRALLLRNLSLVESFLAEHTELFDWVRPRAGCVGFPRVLDGTADELAARLLAQEGVLVVPGSIFGADEARFRLGFGRADLPDALARFARFAVGPRAGSPA